MTIATANKVRWGTESLDRLIPDVKTGFPSGERLPHGVIQVRMNNVDLDGTLDLTTATRIPADESMIETYRLERGDVLFNNTNSTELVGKTAVFPGADEPVLFSNHFSRLRVDPERLDPWYLGRWLSYQQRRRVFRGLCNRWVNQSAVRREALLGLEIPIPFPDDPRRSLAEQKRIAAILDKADAIRRRRQEAARLADTLMMSGFQHIVGPLAQGYRSWKRGTIESLASPEPGSMRTGPFGSDLRHSEFVSEGVAVLGIDNAVQNRFAWDERRFITHDKYEYLQRYTVKPSDVIVTIMGTTGRSAVVPDDIPLAITTKHLATITVNRKVAEPEFVSHSIYRHPEVLTQIANSHRGAIMPGLNLGLIRRLELPVPPPPVQQEFTRFVKSVRELEELHHTKQLAADDLFNALVQRAFRGDL